jgi:tetratricopeptide (TPR) repeat protein
MNKAFLSHSSSDKSIVRPVFDALGHSKAHFDEATFDPLSKSYDAIVESIRGSSLIVVFVSSASLASSWVQEEVSLAIDKASAGRVLRRAVVLLEDVEREMLTPGLLTATSIKNRVPDLIARRILGLLQEIADSSSSSKSFFFGRDNDNFRLKSALLPIDRSPPRAVFLGGVDGIGKRTLVGRAIADAFPMLPRNPRSISVPEDAGPLDVYMHLQGAEHSIGQLIQIKDSFSELAFPDQVRALARHIVEIARRKDYVSIYGAEKLLSEEGDLVQWVGALVDELTNVGYPSLVLLSKRQLAPSYRDSRESMHFQSVFSIDDQDSRRLFVSLVEQHNVQLSAEVVSRFVAVAAGHPGQIVRAARLVAADDGISAALRPNDLVEALSKSASDLVRLLDLDQISATLVRLFSEFGLMSAEDVILAIDGDERVQQSLSKLVDQCIVERVGLLYRTAPYLEAPLRRATSLKVEASFLISARKRIADRLQQFSTDDLASVSVLDQSIVAWLRSGVELPTVPGAKLLLPASLLHAAKGAYDKREYESAAVLSLRAIQGEWTLTAEALGEAYRVRGLALARQNKATEFRSLIEEITSNSKLSELSPRALRKMLAFLMGFFDRLDGRFRDAVKHFEEHNSLGGGGNFKALREHAYALYRLDEFDDAEKFARRALDIAPGNPHVASLLADILMSKLGIGITVNREELDELVQELSANDRANGTSYAVVREAKRSLVDGRPSEALSLLAKASGSRGIDPYNLRLDRAEVLLRMNDFAAALAEIDSTMSAAAKPLGNRILRLRPIATRLKIEALCNLRRVQEAEDLLRRDSHILSVSGKSICEKCISFSTSR